MARILVAEDDDVVRTFVVRALTHAGHVVTEAEDGGIAAEICEEQAGAFDLLLSDIKMPVMDGIALALNVAARLSRAHHFADDGLCRPARARARA